MLTLLEKISLKFRRSKSRIYFIYTHKNGKDRFQNGLTANTELSFWGYTSLRSAFKNVHFLRVEKEKPHRVDSITPHDIVIGHIGETFQKASAKTQRLIAFYPWCGHEDRSTSTLFNCFPKAEEWSILDKCSAAIFLTSEYNQKTYIEAPCNFWFPYLEKFQKEKRLRTVHQPIDLEVFKRIKWGYNTKNFLYIGNNAHMKCLDDSKKLVEQLGKTLTLYGMEKKIDNRDSREVGKLPYLADFFIQPGMWEGQCVSILEAAARGFIPVVSPETGYPYDHPFLLRYGNFEFNLMILKKLLNTSPIELKELGDRLHHLLVEDINHNHWEKLTSVLVEEVKQLMVN